MLINAGREIVHVSNGLCHNLCDTSRSHLDLSWTCSGSGRIRVGLRIFRNMPHVEYVKGVHRISLVRTFTSNFCSFTAMSFPKTRFFYKRSCPFGKQILDMLGFACSILHKIKSVQSKGNPRSSWTKDAFQGKPCPKQTTHYLAYTIANGLSNQLACTPTPSSVRNPSEPTFPPPPP